MSDYTALQTAIELKNGKAPVPQVYHIHWRDRCSGQTGVFPGEFPEADKNLWLESLNRCEGPRFEYWAEPVS